jgi:hypothetical protein
MLWSESELEGDLDLNRAGPTFLSDEEVATDFVFSHCTSAGSTSIYLRKKNQLESLHDKNSDLNSNTSLLLNKHFFV